MTRTEATWSGFRAGAKSRSIARAVGAYLFTLLLLVALAWLTQPERALLAGRMHQVLAISGAFVAALLAWLSAARADTEAEARAREEPAMAPPLSDAAQASIAVLPLACLSGSADDAVVAQGFSAEIVRALSGVPDLRVVPFMQSALYADRPLNAIARELNVRYVLSGSLQRLGSQVRVIATLTDVGSDRQVWGESYDRGIARSQPQRGLDLSQCTPVLGRGVVGKRVEHALIEHEAEQHVRHGIARLEGERLLEPADRLHRCFTRVGHRPERQRLVREAPRRQSLRRLAAEVVGNDVQVLRPGLDRDRLGQFALHVEEVADAAVVGFAPHLPTAAHVRQRGNDAHLRAQPLQAAREYVAHVQFARGVVERPVRVERRLHERHDAQVRHARQGTHDFGRKTLRYDRIVRGPGEAAERQHRDRGLRGVGQRRSHHGFLTRAGFRFLVCASRRQPGGQCRHDCPTDCEHLVHLAREQCTLGLREPRQCNQQQQREQVGADRPRDAS